MLDCCAATMLLKWIKSVCFPLNALVGVEEPFVVLWESGALHEAASLLMVSPSNIS